MASLADIDRIDDENTLESLINTTEDINIRMRIRKRQREIREKRLAAFEANKTPRTEDATTMRLRLAAAEKQRKMQEFESKAKELKEMGGGEVARRERYQRANEEKQRKLDQYQELGKASSSIYNMGVSELLKKDTTNDAIDGFSIRGAEEIPPGANGRNPTAIKQMLLDWCKQQTQGYQNVNVTNFSTSWADGLAFCALIHHFFPNAFDYSKLTPNDRRGNFKLAFSVAQKEAGIAPILDADDMVRMKTPDWKCVFTYVQGFYRRFGMPQQQLKQ